MSFRCWVHWWFLFYRLDSLGSEEVANSRKCVVFVVLKCMYTWRFEVRLRLGCFVVFEIVLLVVFVGRSVLPWCFAGSDWCVREAEYLGHGVWVNHIIAHSKTKIE